MRKIMLIKYIFFIFILFIWFGLFSVGFSSYQGSKLLFCFFSFSFLILLITGFYKNKSYSFMFLTLFLWLGFWLKLVVHLALEYPYVESTGAFDGSIDAWDKVLLVATVASIGLLIGRFLYVNITKGRLNYSCERLVYPVWYPMFRRKIWAVLLFSIVIVALINAFFGIQQIGLASRTIFPWPLNAIIAWLVSIGGAMGVVTLLWWDVSLKKSPWGGMFIILMEAFLSTTSLLSRGVFLFHSIPQLLALYKNKSITFERRYKPRVLIFLCFYLFLFILSISSVTTLRALYYPDVNGVGFTTKIQQKLTRLEVLEGGVKHAEMLIQQGEKQEGHLRELIKERDQIEIDLSSKRARYNDNSMPNKEMFPFGGAGEIKIRTNSTSGPGLRVENENDLYDEWIYQIKIGAFEQVMALGVDRWVGLEGLMAVVAYPDKNSKLIIDALKEKREIGKVTQYQTISKSIYQWTDSEVWQFASLPGAVAFLYFSGSLLVVILGMTTFTFLILSVEDLVFIITGNPLLCSLLGMVIANFVAQFGITPRQDIPYFLMISIAVIAIWLVQNRKVKSFKSERL
tara:strand:+ start:4753 stop:6462 length:1710 start_codon:yes stop_codon:yes gene_type:complete